MSWGRPIVHQAAVLSILIFAGGMLVGGLCVFFSVEDTKPLYERIDSLDLELKRSDNELADAKKAIADLTKERDGLQKDFDDCKAKLDKAVELSASLAIVANTPNVYIRPIDTRSGKEIQDLSASTEPKPGLVPARYLD